MKHELNLLAFLFHFYKLVKKVMYLGLPTRFTYLKVHKDLSAKLYA